MFTQGSNIVHLLRWKKIFYLSRKDTIESWKKIPNQEIDSKIILVGD